MILDDDLFHWFECWESWLWVIINPISEGRFILDVGAWAESELNTSDLPVEVGHGLILGTTRSCGEHEVLVDGEVDDIGVLESSLADTLALESDETSDFALLLIEELVACVDVVPFTVEELIVIDVLGDVVVSWADTVGGELHNSVANPEGEGSSCWDGKVLGVVGSGGETCKGEPCWFLDEFVDWAVP